MNSLVGGFAPPCSQHKDAVGPDDVDAKRKRKNKSAESLCHGFLENIKEQCWHGHEDCSQMWSAPTPGRNGVQVVTSFQSYQSLSLHSEVEIIVAKGETSSGSASKFKRRVWTRIL